VTSLLLIRHGQASFHSHDYDQLSELGVEQSRRLGRFVARADRRLDVLCSGPLKRQLGTAEAMREGAREEGKELPEIVILDELVEYPAIEILKRGIPHMVDDDDELKSWLGPALEDLTVLGRIPEFNRVFRRMVQHWIGGALGDLEDLEPFEAFVARTRSAVKKLEALAGDGRAAAVTSGGPVGLALQEPLGLSDRKALRLTEVVANTGLTELRPIDGELTMVAFNALPHLRDKNLVTFR
jgi:broad specificity phosphatase PhoE